MKEDIKKGINEALNMLYPYRINESIPDPAVDPEGEFKEGEPDLDAVDAEEENPLLAKIYDIDDVLFDKDEEWEEAVKDAFDRANVNSWEELLEKDPSIIEDYIKYGRDIISAKGINGNTANPNVQANIDWNDNTGYYGNYFNWDPIGDWIEDNVPSALAKKKIGMSAELKKNIALALMKEFSDDIKTEADGLARVEKWMEEEEVTTTKESPEAYLGDYVELQRSRGWQGAKGAPANYGIPFSAQEVATMEKMLIRKFQYDPAKAKSVVANFMKLKNIAIHEMKRLSGNEYNSEDDPEYIARKQKEDDDAKAEEIALASAEERYLEKKHGIDEVGCGVPGASKSGKGYTVMGAPGGKLKSVENEYIQKEPVPPGPKSPKPGSSLIGDDVNESKMKFTNREVLALMETTPDDIELYKKVSEKTGLSVAHLRRMAARKESKARKPIENEDAVGPTTRGYKQDFEAGGTGKLREDFAIKTKNARRDYHGGPVGKLREDSAIGKIPLKRQIPSGKLRPSGIG